VTLREFTGSWAAVVATAGLGQSSNTEMMRPNVTAAGQAGSSLPRSLGRASLNRAVEEFPGDGRLPEGATAGRVRRDVGEM
jgi:hypothetical protein